MSGNQMEMCHLLFRGSHQVMDPPSCSFWQVMKQQGSKGSGGGPLEKSHLFQSPHSSSFKPGFLCSSPSLWWLKALSFARCRASHSVTEVVLLKPFVICPSVTAFTYFRPSEERLGCSGIKCLIQAQTHLIRSVSVPGMRPVQDGLMSWDGQL